MAGKTKEVEIGYIDKLAQKSTISNQLANKLKSISESRYTNLVKSVSGPEYRKIYQDDAESMLDSTPNGSRLKKVKLEIRGEADQTAAGVTLQLLNPISVKAKTTPSRIPLIRDCCL